MKTIKDLVNGLLGRLILSFGWLYGFVVFRIKNKIKIIGRENIPKQGKVLFVSNHETLIDSFLIGCAVCRLTDMVFNYRAVPWNTPDRKNFFSKKILGWLFSYLKNIPISRDKPGTKIMMKELAEVGQKLSAGDNVAMFFEGTRTRDGEIGECQAGVAGIISEHKPTVIPIFLDNVQKVMPIKVGFDFVWPAFPFIILLRFKPKFKPKFRLNFKLKIIIKPRVVGKLVIGQPINFNGLLNKDQNRETRREIGWVVRQAVVDLKNSPSF